MNKSVIVYGPKGCGKTRNAERLRAHFGLDHVIDDWAPGRDGGLIPMFGVLVLTSAVVPDLHFKHGVRWVDFDSAMRGTRGAVTSERRERIATAALQGILVNCMPGSGWQQSVALRAVAAADALIAELDK